MLANKNDEAKFKEINKILDEYLNKKSKVKPEYYKAPGDELMAQIQELMPEDCYVTEFLGKVAISTVKTDHLVRNDFLTYDQPTRNLVIEVMKAKQKLFDINNDLTNKTIFIKWITKLEEIQFN